MDKTIRAQVFARAHDRCEVPECIRMALHFDHFFGRAKAEETVENGWAQCLIHSEAKTASRPSATFWQRAFIHHCCFQIGRLEAKAFGAVGTIAGYAAARARAQTKLEVLFVKGFN